MLAIVIPYFKIQFFEDTLISLINQTDRNFTVYVGNDGSSEDPLQLISKYNKILKISYKKFPRNLGKESLVSHWARCLNMVEGENWFMLLGDDDILERHVVESFHNHYHSFFLKANVIRFATQVINEDSEVDSGINKHPIWEKPENSFYRKYLELTRSSLSEYIFRRESYLKYKFFDYPLGWHSDDRAWLEFSNGKPIYSINEATVFIRVSQHSISGRIDNRRAKRQATLSFYRFILRRIKNFDKEQRSFLKQAYEKEIKIERPLNAKEWFFLLYVYIKDFNFYQFKKFLKRSMDTSTRKNS